MHARLFSSRLLKSCKMTEELQIRNHRRRLYHRVTQRCAQRRGTGLESMGKPADRRFGTLDSTHRHEGSWETDKESVSNGNTPIWTPIQHLAPESTRDHVRKLGRMGSDGRRRDNMKTMCEPRDNRITTDFKRTADSRSGTWRCFFERRTTGFQHGYSLSPRQQAL